MKNVIKPSAPNERAILLASRSRDGRGDVFPRLPEVSPAAGLYEDVELAGPAVLYSYTVIHPNPKTGKMPFVLVLADYPDSARVCGRLDLPPEKVRIGMHIEARALPVDDAAVYFFVPAGDH